MTSERALQEAIHENVELVHAAEAKKYEQISALAGDKRRELSARKLAVNKAYKEWHKLSAAVITAKHPSAEQYRALEAASEKYAQVSRGFTDLQAVILEKKDATLENIVSAEAINALNAAAPSAAGKKSVKTAARKLSK